MTTNTLPLPVKRPTLWRNLLDLPRSMVGSVWLAGLLVVVISYSGPLLLAFDAAEKAHLTQAQLASWIWAITFVSGIATLSLSLWHRQPVITAWSTPGLALLASSLASYSLPEAVGAYIAVGLATMILGFSGLFDRLLALIPQPVAVAVLGGVLLRYGLGLFTAIPDQPWIVLAMIAVFLFFRRAQFRTTMAFVLVVGVAIAFFFGQVHVEKVQVEIVRPVVIWPVFSLPALLNLGVPLFVLAMASQNAPGVAVMKAFHYRAPVNSSLIVTGLATLLTAPMLNHGLNLAAITAAVCNSPEAHPDPDRRYAAGVAAGLVKMTVGTFGTTVVAIFAGLPKPLIAAAAGLGLIGTLVNCFAGAMAESDQRDAALLAFLLTASNVQFFGISSAFWGLVAGVVVSRALKRM